MSRVPVGGCTVRWEEYEHTPDDLVALRRLLEELSCWPLPQGPVAAELFTPTGEVLTLGVHRQRSVLVHTAADGAAWITRGAHDEGPGATFRLRGRAVHYAERHVVPWLPAETAATSFWYRGERSDHELLWERPGTTGDDTPEDRLDRMLFEYEWDQVVMNGGLSAMLRPALPLLSTLDDPRLAERVHRWRLRTPGALCLLLRAAADVGDTALSRRIGVALASRASLLEDHSEYDPHLHAAWDLLPRSARRVLAERPGVRSRRRRST